MRLIAALVRGDDVGRAQNDVVSAIGAVTGGICGAEKGNGRSAESNREVQRAGIAADDARRVAQESHQWTEWTIVRHWVCVAAAFADGEGEIVFAGAIVHNAANAERFSNHAAEVAEALRRPAFRTPAAAGAQDDVAIEAERLEMIANAAVVLLRNTQIEWSDGITRSRAEGQFAVLIGDVRGGGVDAFGVKNRNTEFTDCF